MNFLLVAWISWISVSFASCEANEEDAPDMNTTDLNYVMSWMTHFSAAYQNNQKEYEAGINQLGVKLSIESDFTFKDALTRFLADVTTLRNELVNKPYENIVMGTSIEHNIKAFVLNIAIVSDMLHDMNDNIKEWEKASNDVPAAVNVTDRKPSKWFSDHGIGKEVLRAMPIEELKKVLDKMCGPKTIFHILQYFSTCAFNGDILYMSQKLAWLKALSGADEALKSLEYVLKKGVHVSKDKSPEEAKAADDANAAKASDDANAAKASDDANAAKVRAGISVVKALHDLSGDGKPLANFIGLGEDKRLYTAYSTVYDNFCFRESHVPAYFSNLTKICGTLVPEITKLEQDLRSSNADNLNKLLKKLGFGVGGVHYNGAGLADRAKELTGDNGPVTVLCKAVDNYNKVTKPPSEVDTAVSANDLPKAGEPVTAPTTEDKRAAADGRNTTLGPGLEATTNENQNKETGPTTNKGGDGPTNPSGRSSDASKRLPRANAATADEGRDSGASETTDSTEASTNKEKHTSARKRTGAEPSESSDKESKPPSDGKPKIKPVFRSKNGTYAASHSSLVIVLLAYVITML